jgi:hypothetical protein
MDERLRFDYDRTIDLLRSLTDIRFKLLAFIPTVAGAAVGFLGLGKSTGQLLGVGLLGLTATCGVLLYELGNERTAEKAARHAAELEVKLGLDPLNGPGEVVSAARVHGLALVYGAALAGWTYVVAWGALRALDVGSPRKTGGAIGLAVGVVIILDLVRIGRHRRGAAASPAKAFDLR